MNLELNHNGKKYISVVSAAHITGYNRDYIGQLCRANLIDATKFGQRWFVDLDILIEYLKVSPTDLLSVSSDQQAILIKSSNSNIEVLSEPAVVDFSSSIRKETKDENSNSELSKNIFVSIVDSPVTPVQHSRGKSFKFISHIAFAFLAIVLILNSVFVFRNNIGDLISRQTEKSFFVSESFSDSGNVISDLSFGFEKIPIYLSSGVSTLVRSGGTVYMEVKSAAQNSILLASDTSLYAVSNPKHFLNSVVESILQSISVEGKNLASVFSSISSMTKINTDATEIDLSGDTDNVGDVPDHFVSAFSDFEMKDSVTSEIYCIRIKNGEWDKKVGNCSSIDSYASSGDVPQFKVYIPPTDEYLSPATQISTTAP
ncbi:MAG: hypothetical protein EXS46_00815 [Candidatus Taylorbacteria bacterium]|nr:hypothetical protein [Candidatus Taylorbacteria bacterium]